MLNVALAREIYGGGVLAIDQRSFTGMLNLLSDFRGGAIFDNSEKERLNPVGFMNAGTRVVSYSGSIDPKSDDQYISMTRVNGPIVKNGGMSTSGTKEMGEKLLGFDDDAKIIGHILYIDSGGGSTAGMEVMNWAIDNLKKPVASVIERGGVAYSAAYGIASRTGRIFAESKKSGVGSVGVMISFKAAPNKSVDTNGEKQVTIYATNSTKKNLWFEQALNNDDYELAINEQLDPEEQEFRGNVKAKRPGVTDGQVNGSVYKAGDVLGSLVDEIGGIPEAVNWIKGQQGAATYSGINRNSNQNKNKAMTLQELQAQHPALYAEVFGAGRTAGINAERDRVGSWMAHAVTDMEIVKAGIKDGSDISATVREELLVKAHSKASIGNIQADNAPPVNTPEAKDTDKDVAPTEVQTLFAGAKKHLQIDGLKKK